MYANSRILDKSWNLAGEPAAFLALHYLFCVVTYSIILAGLIGMITRYQEENKIEEVAALSKSFDYFSDLVYGHWLGQKGLKIDSMEW